MEKSPPPRTVLSDHNAPDVLAHAGSESDRFEFIHRRTLEPAPIPFHLHDCHELYYVVSGEILFLIEDRAYQVKPRDILIIDRRELHSPKFLPGQQQHERIIVHFQPSYFDSYQTAQYNLLRFLRKERLGLGNLIRGDENDTEPFYRSLLAMEDHVLHPRPESELMITTHLIQAMVCLNNLHIHSGPASPENPQYDRKIMQILPYLQEHLSEPLSLEHLERTFAVNRFHLCHLFKENTGFTIGEYLTNKRIMRALAAIRQGTPLKQAAIEAGYPDYSNFFRTVRRVTGLSPKQLQHQG